MSSAQQDTQANPCAQANALADVLSRKGFATTVLATGGHQRHPCVRVTNRSVCHLSEDVYAADAEGHWWFWWPWAEPISRINHVDRRPTPSPTCWALASDKRQKGAAPMGGALTGAERTIFGDIRDAGNITLIRAELHGEQVAVIAAIDRWRDEILLAPLAILATDTIKTALTPPPGMQRGYVGVIFRGCPHEDQTNDGGQTSDGGEAREDGQLINMTDRR